MKQWKSAYGHRRHVWKRLGALPLICTTFEVLKALHCHEKTLRGWLKSEEWQKIGIARYDATSGRWQIDKPKLLTWLVTTERIAPAPCAEDIPDDYMLPDECAKSLGFPVASVRQQRNLEKDTQ